MAIEIERKFLVNSAAVSKIATHASAIKKITQGYLFNEPSKTIRVRLSESNKRQTAYLTIKGPKIGSMSVVFEYSIPYDDGLHLLTMCEHTLTKTRYNITDDHGQQWEVDVFDGLNKGLVVAEIEMADADQHVVLPEWVGREVTTDPNYANAVLIKRKAQTE